jgi:hypothetical protein
MNRRFTLLALPSGRMYCKKNYLLAWQLPIWELIRVMGNRFLVQADARIIICQLIMISCKLQYWLGLVILTLVSYIFSKPVSSNKSFGCSCALGGHCVLVPSLRLPGWDHATFSISHSAHLLEAWSGLPPSRIHDSLGAWPLVPGRICQPCPRRVLRQPTIRHEWSGWLVN